MSTTRLSVSVVLPCYNCARFIGAAVESALSQEPPPDEVIVVDDGSVDDPAAALARFGGRVCLIRQENGGTAAARNTGITAARGEYIGLLDGDDIWLPGMLAGLLRAAARWPQAALIHARCDTMTAGGERLPRPDALPPGDCLEEDALERLMVHCYPNFSTVLLRRDAIRETGLFTKGIRAEDWEFCLRLAERHPFAYVGEPLALYRLHDAQKTADRIGNTEGLLQVRRVIEERLPRWAASGARDASTIARMEKTHREEYAKAYSRLSRLREKQGDPVGACEAAREAARLQPRRLKYRARAARAGLRAALHRGGNGTGDAAL